MPVKREQVTGATPYSGLYWFLNGVPQLPDALNAALSGNDYTTQQEREAQSIIAAATEQIREKRARSAVGPADDRVEIREFSTSKSKVGSLLMRSA